VGALIGGVAMTLLLGDAAAYSGQIISDGMRIGAAAGVLTFSRKQEMEADYLAAYIISRAGFNLDGARGMLVKLGRLGGRTTSSVLDTHPAGPERVAAWDLATREIRSGSPMPRKR
jgi:predicted Zn-dependent protease